MEKKYVCLSFDDGPNNVGNDNTMNDMLDILEKHNIPASFFLIANKITEENKKVILRACKMGCDIQNHTWSHPAMADLPEEQIKEEFQKCDDIIFEITGKRPEFFRPPFISVSEKMYECISLPFICGCGCSDWEADKDADYRYKKMLEDAQNGVIYLLHVMEGNLATLQAVDRIIPVLKEQGYEFVNLPDLFKKTNVNPVMDHSLWSIANNDLSANKWPR